MTPQGFIDIVCQDHTYSSTPFYTGTEATDNYEILKIGDNVIGLRLGVNSDNTMKVDMLRWGLRWCEDGRWTHENKNNSFLWYSSNYMIFNYIYDYYDFEAGKITHPGEYLINVSKKVQYGCHAAPIRAIHKH